MAHDGLAGLALIGTGRTVRDRWRGFRSRLHSLVSATSWRSRRWRRAERIARKEAYERLRKSLATGNLAARLYRTLLTALLDKVERFFGDSGMADRTLFPHAFGLKTPAPLWTAPALDRCVVIALFYPLATITLIWVVSGHVGPAEAAVGLTSDVSVWQRGLFFGSVLTVILATRHADWFLAALWTLAVAIGAGLIAELGTSSIAIAFTAALGAAFSSIAGAGVALAIVAVAALASWRTGVALSIGYMLVVGAASMCVVAVAWLQDIAKKRQWEGLFLSMYLPLMILFCFGAAEMLSDSPKWLGGRLLLFLGLLTVLHAPFDWASLGLTRALLRRGLERGGWWPLLYGLIDAAFAPIIIAALALTMVVGVQAFDQLVAHGGGKRILPLDSLFDGIAANPSAPEYWWAYALLLSTMIPSLINLMIGGASLMRGVPGVSQLLLHFMPATKAVPAFDRAWLALVLTSQSAGGAILGLFAQLLIAYGMLAYFMPWFGLALLDVARAVAALELPTRVGQLFGVIL